MQYSVLIKTDNVNELNTIINTLQGVGQQAPTLTGQGAQIQAEVQAQQAPPAQQTYQQAPVQQPAVPVQQPAPIQAPPQPVPTQAPPVQQAPPIQQAPVAQQQPPQAVPTSAPTYVLEDLQRAASQLMADVQKQQALRDLLPLFGIQQLNHLPQEQYGAFATKLRELGAKL